MSSNSGKTQTSGLDDEANVADFMSRFSDPNTHVPPTEATQRFDQLAESGHPELHQAVNSYLSQMDPGQVTQAVQSLHPDQRAGFASGLLGALSNAGIDLGSIARTLGLSSTDPRQMRPEDLGNLAGYAQQKAPAALQQTAREQPFLLRALGNPLVQGALAIMAARYMANRNR